MEGFRRWAHSPDFPERGRISLIDGEVVIDISPERMGSHNKAKTRIVAVLDSYVDEFDLGDLYSDGVLLTNDAAELSTEPDACFVRNETWNSGRVVAVARSDEDDGAELQGAPDWVLEVISPSSVRKDTDRLLVAYFEAGIPEYGLVDVRNDPTASTFSRGATRAMKPPSRGTAGSLRPSSSASSASNASDAA